jgi:hypothetical protein
MGMESGKKKFGIARIVAAASLLFLAAVIALVAYSRPSSESAPKDKMPAQPIVAAESKSEPAPHGVNKIKHGNWIGYSHIDLLTRSVALAASGDNVAWKKQIMQCVSSGQCVALAEGQDVYVEAPYSTGVIVVRVKGETESWLLPVEAVQ